MLKDFDDFKYLLYVTSEITDFVLTIPIKTRATRVVAEIWPTYILHIGQRFSFYRRGYLIHADCD